MDNIETVVISAVVGALVAFVGTYAKELIEARGNVSQEIRTKRRTVYESLWGHTVVLPLWPKNTLATYQDVQELTETLRDWYFGEGGMYLSTESQKYYLAAQKVLCGAVAAKASNLDVKVNDPDYDNSRQALSDLRTQITLDLASRKRRPFGV